MLRLYVVSALPIVATLILAWVNPLLTLFGWTVTLLALALWPLPMGEFVWRSRGQCSTPAAHQAPLPCNKDSIATFYYPGLGGSWMQGLRYTGQEGLPPSVKLYIGDQAIGPDAHIPNGPRLLENVCPIDPPEVIIDGSLLAMPFFYTYVTTLAGRAMQNVIMGDDYVLAWPWVNWGQRDDIQHFLGTVRAAMDTPGFKGRQLVLAGSSRGAATVLGAVAQMTMEEHRRIAFVLLEGIYDSIPSVCGPIVPRLLSWVSRYDPLFPSPVQLAAQFPSTVPVLFVTSRADWIVPPTKALAVRDAVLRARANRGGHVHTLILKHSHHSFFVNDHIGDQTAYRAKMEEMHRLYCVQ